MPEKDKYFIASPFVDAFEQLQYRQTITGIENIPTEGRGIIAPNHLRAADSLMIPAVVAREIGRKVIFAAKDTYFQGEIDLLGHRFRTPRRVFFEDFTQAIPVDRSGNPRAIMEFNDAAIKVLEEDELLAIHWEGTRSIDGRMYKPRSGMAHIALASEAPIIPTAITYPVPNLLHLRQEAHISFLTPIPFEEYKDLKRFEIGDLVRERVQAETGQEYVDQYAPILTKEERKERIRQLKRAGK